MKKGWQQVTTLCYKFQKQNPYIYHSTIHPKMPSLNKQNKKYACDWLYTKWSNVLALNNTSNEANEEKHQSFLSTHFVVEQDDADEMGCDGTGW